MRRRVVITGRGVVSPLGDTVAGMFRALCAGRSGVGLITRFDASTLPTRIAAEVKGFDLTRYIDEPQLWRNATENSQFAVAASALALQEAGLSAPSDAERSRFGVYLGGGEGRQDLDAVLPMVAHSYLHSNHTMDESEFAEQAMARYRGPREFELELHTSPAHLADYFGLEGPNFSCLTACAAGSQAIGEAVELIRDGDADLMLAGGAHSMIHLFGVSGFNLLTALSTSNEEPERASRPFDRLRNGFVLGEGAGMLVLEELDHARRRGATILAEITGYGSTCDAFRVTDCHPEGRGARACLRAALEDARLQPADIGYINAHGTSTQQNDRVESLAIKNTLGAVAQQIPVSSTKSMLGHLIGAAGAVELIICTEVLRQGIAPPTINYEHPDPDCDLDYIPNVAREVCARHTLSNSFGFGGQNITLITSRYE